MVLFEFQDLNHTISFEEIRNRTITQVQQYYDRASYGRIKVRGDIVEGWRTLSLRVPFKMLDVSQWNYNADDMRLLDEQAVEKIKEIAPSYDYPLKFVVYAGGVWGHARGSGPLAGHCFQNEKSGLSTYLHELGHLVGLPDMYSYEAARKDQYSGANVGAWDMMSTNTYAGDFNAWSKLRLGWIRDDQVIDINEPSGRVFTVDALGNNSASTLLLRVPKSPGKSYYVEVRERIGPDMLLYRRIQTGVLIYIITNSYDMREGGIVVVDSHPKSYSTSTPWAELFDAPFGVGRNQTAALVDKDSYLSIVVLGKIGNSYRIMVGDSALGEAANEANGVLSQAEEAIAKAVGEMRLSGLDQARSQLREAYAAFGKTQFPVAVTSAKSAIQQANSATKSTATGTSGTRTGSMTTLSTQQILLFIVLAAAISCIALFYLRSRKKHNDVGSVSTGAK